MRNRKKLRFPTERKINSTFTLFITHPLLQFISDVPFLNFIRYHPHLSTHTRALKHFVSRRGKLNFFPVRRMDDKERHRKKSNLMRSCSLQKAVCGEKKDGPRWWSDSYSVSHFLMQLKNVEDNGNKILKAF